MRRSGTAIDWAQQSKLLVDGHHPEAERIVLVVDTLNSHRSGTLYTALPPAAAKRLTDTLEAHYIRKHGSWSNMAEIQLSALGRQWLARCIPDMATLQTAVTTWAVRRNAAGGKIDWRCIPEDARIQLKRLYLKIQE